MAIPTFAEKPSTSRWNAALPQGPDTSVKITDGYARAVARQAYVWGWPLVNIYNRRLAFAQSPKVGLMNGVLPFAPLNRLAMLSDYIRPDQRWVACPNQDVVYGAGICALEQGPVVVQVPDFGDRFWVYQVVDLRTESFARLGAMYGTRPGFYLLAGPDWTGSPPQGITEVFQSATNTAFVVPRVFQDDTAEDKQAVQSLIGAIDIYPLDEFDGSFKRHDWGDLPTLGSPTDDDDAGETRWVFPETFFDQLPAVLLDAPPLAGEETLYGQIRSLIEIASRDDGVKAAIVDEARKAEDEVVAPLLQFRNWGQQLPHHWSTLANFARFGSDYFSRTAVARSNILVNAANETIYLYQDLDMDGARLNGANRYAVTFAAGSTPPVDGFWSLTLYDEHHFFAPNAIKRYSVGTKNRDLVRNQDGSLTIHVQAERPAGDAAANWLPAPAGADFSLYLRAYGPQTAILDGTWTPPPVKRV